MDTFDRTASSSPTLGVMPPSIKLLHNSIRCAPPRSAATADATESTHTSIRISLLISGQETRKSSTTSAIALCFKTLACDNLHSSAAIESGVNCIKLAVHKNPDAVYSIRILCSRWGRDALKRVLRSHLDDTWVPELP